MKKLLIVLNLLLIFSFSAHSQESKKEKKFALYSVAFYNLENLFDTVHDKGKQDFEYLPNGGMKWNSMKYLAKLKNMAQVISQLATDKLPNGPVAIGVAEAENIGVLNDLVAQPALAPRGYKVILHEGPDARGIDCGFIYNPKAYTVQASKIVQNVNANDTIHKTRAFLVVSGLLAGERVHFIVNHWPSRGAAEPVRVHAAKQVRVIKDSLLTAEPTSKVIIMGDMNDDPQDESMSVALGAKRNMDEVEQGGLYNPWWETLVGKGVGTLAYRGSWNLFDQIVVSSNFLGNDRSTLKYFKNEVFVRDYMIQQEGKYKGSPKRTTGGGVWLNGYSDHLPTIIYLVKEMK